ncbi:MAG: hypothetical protein AB7V48_15320 [Sedimentibacter sp.]
MNIVNKLNLKPNINKVSFYNKLHIIENTETFKSAELVYDELVEILKNNMHLNALYVITEPFDVAKNSEWDKFILCFISSEDSINDVVGETMSRGEYLKGYLLNEMSTYALFNASNEMNKIIREEAVSEGYALSKRQSAGDGEIELKEQNTILSRLKKHVSINAFVNEEHVIVPQKSLLYFYGLKKQAFIDDDDDNFSICNECGSCTKINCEYKEIG